MPHKPPGLAAVAASEDDAKKRKKARGVLAALGALLGIGAKPNAKMSKRTITTKRTEMEESDTDGGDSSAEEEEEEEEEAEDSATDMTQDSDADDSSAEEEEEEEEGRAEGDDEGEAKYEEEEEEEGAAAKGLARALRTAYRSPKVKAAFLAAVPEKHRAAAALRTPERVVREMRKATGAKSIDGAMTALSRSRAKAATGDAKVIRATATLAAKVSKIEKTARTERVNAIVKEAKAEGKATTHDLREQLRAYGNGNGAKALRALIATLPIAAPTREKIANVDGAGNLVGAPGSTEQRAEMAMFGHLKGKDLEEAQAEYRAGLAKLNGKGGQA